MLVVAKHQSQGCAVKQEHSMRRRGSLPLVGDVHNFLDELHELLEKVDFHQDIDILLFTGDLGNRALILSR